MFLVFKFVTGNIIEVSAAHSGGFFMSEPKRAGWLGPGALAQELGFGGLKITEAVPGFVVSVCRHAQVDAPYNQKAVHSWWTKSCMMRRNMRMIFTGLVSFSLNVNADEAHA